MEYERVLVLCIDRDADIEKKLGEKGPIYGIESLLDIATRLGLEDPMESDTNALFETVKLGKKFKGEGRLADVAVITGSEYVGVESDAELSRQLEKVLKKYDVDGTVIVTDGAEDEYILPIVESKTNVIALKRVIVKQAARLESTYYILLDFLKDVVNDPKLSRLLVGLPGIALISYMLLGQHGWRLIAGVVGVFLLIKGFNLEGQVEKVYDDLKSSFITGKISFFTYVVAALIGIVGIINGYDQLRKQAFATYIQGVPIFFSGRTLTLLMFAAIVALIGKSIDAILEGRNIGKYLIFGVFVIALGVIVDAISRFILGYMDMATFAIWIIVGLALSLFAIIAGRSTKETQKAIHAEIEESEGG
ncbi:MAG: DUF373 family protein [Candidatus Hydrothermarchaeales archaeon]